MEVFSLQSSVGFATGKADVPEGYGGYERLFFCPQLSVFVRCKVGVLGVGEDRWDIWDIRDLRDADEADQKDLFFR